VRVAHLALDAGPIDICLAPHGSTSFSGPMLQQAGVAAPGLAYAQATRYLPVPADQYDVRVVAGGAVSCDVGMVDTTDLPALVADQNVTIAALGLMHPPAGNDNAIAIKLYVDDSGLAPGPVAVRFIHASPDTPSVDAGTGSGNQFSAAFLDVAYGAVGQGSTSGANGYVMLPPLQQAPLLTVRLAGAGDDALTFTPPAVPSWGDTITAFLIGDYAGSPQPFKALVCTDNGMPDGALADCAVRP